MPATFTTHIPGVYLCMIGRSNELRVERVQFSGWPHYLGFRAKIEDQRTCMPAGRSSVIYKNSARSRCVMGEFSIQQFEADCHQNGIRFWYAHEFMRALGYDSWATFQKVVTKAMGGCARLNIDPTESFIPATYSRDGKECKTYKLSRFACFLVSMYADTNKPEVALAKATLAAIADTLVEERIRETDLGRIETRDDLKAAERLLSGVAQSAGLENSAFGIFKDAGFRGMYNMSLKQLMVRKGVAPKNILYDFMGLEELAGNLFRVTQTASRINSSDVRGLPALSQTAKQVGKEVRNIMTKDNGTAPELLEVAEDIAGVKKRLKTANKGMMKMDDGPRAKPPALLGNA
jgi:DNA-damage-inducible protein D